MCIPTRSWGGSADAFFSSSNRVGLENGEGTVAKNAKKVIKISSVKIFTDNRLFLLVFSCVKVYNGIVEILGFL